MLLKFIEIQLCNIVSLAFANQVPVIRICLLHTHACTHTHTRAPAHRHTRERTATHTHIHTVSEALYCSSRPHLGQLTCVACSPAYV
jgi:hypothetical protein